MARFPIILALAGAATALAAVAPAPHLSATLTVGSNQPRGMEVRSFELDQSLTPAATNINGTGSQVPTPTGVATTLGLQFGCGERGREEARRLLRALGDGEPVNVILDVSYPSDPGGSVTTIEADGLAVDPAAAAPSPGDGCPTYRFLVNGQVMWSQTGTLPEPVADNYGFSLYDHHQGRDLFSNFIDFHSVGLTLPPNSLGLFFLDRPWLGDVQLKDFLAAEVGDGTTYGSAFAPVFWQMAPVGYGYQTDYAPTDYSDIGNPKVPPLRGFGSMTQLSVHVSDRGSDRETIWLVTNIPLL